MAICVSAEDAVAIHAAVIHAVAIHAVAIHVVVIYAVVVPVVVIHAAVAGKGGNCRTSKKRLKVLKKTGILK